MLSKRPQSELVLIHVVILNYFPLLDDAVTVSSLM
jgi:hypothetical protein